MSFSMRPLATSFSSTLRIVARQQLRSNSRAILSHRPSGWGTPISQRGALRAVTSVASSIGHSDTATITVGAALPAAVPVKEHAADKPLPFEFPAGKHIIVGVPGAFTGTCHKQIPGYIEHFDAFKAKGVEQIAVVAVNDVFVLKAWKENLAPGGTPVRFISDDCGALTKALGLHFDATPVLGGVRSKRYVIVANGSEVETIAVEQVPSQLTVTDAKTILAQLG